MLPVTAERRRHSRPGGTRIGRTLEAQPGLVNERFDRTGHAASMSPRAEGWYEGILLSLPLRTERLVLRAFRADDYDALYAIQSREDVGRYLPWGPRDAAAVRAGLEARLSGTSFAHEGDRLGLAVTLAETGELIGECVLMYISEAHRLAEIGFGFHPDHQGRGYATEVGRELLRLAFEDFDLHRAVARLDARNDASARVMERLSMRREAHFIENELNKGDWESELVYAILQREWRELLTS
jgi:RimJ/RimL family protein N-acetyltransferase